MKFYIETLGCKVNAYESEFISEQLEKEYQKTKNAEKADIIILNTCSVTNVADKKSLKIFRHLKKINSKAIFVVMGCSSQNNKEKYKDLGIHILLGNKDKNKVLFLIKEYIKTKEKYEYILPNLLNVEFDDMQISHFNHIRAYIKIQDGCNNYCSYCIIPYLRGTLRCKEYQKVLCEANTLVKNGYKEITLTGIHTGSYKSENKDLYDLISDLSHIKGLERIRLSSIEITELNDKFLNLLKENKVLCDHLHIPLQAGSDHVLKIMNRKYDLNYYEEKIKKIRNILPDISIACDLIVGFPNETEEDFESTINFCEKINFSKIHVFPYSRREGTAASKYEEVSTNIKKERTRIMLEISKKCEKEYFNKFINKTLPVLIEEVKEGYSYGHTTNFLKIKIKGNLEVNKIYDITIKEEYYDNCSRED